MYMYIHNIKRTFDYTWTRILAHAASKGMVHGPLSSSTYPMIIHTHHIASNLLKKTLVAKQWPTTHFTNRYNVIYMYMYM